MTSHYASELLIAYYADLAYAKHLSAEEQQALIAETAQHATHLDRDARNRFIEEYLALAKNLVLKHCPSTYCYLLPDIIGEVNLALVQAAERYNILTPGKFSTYIHSVVEGAIKTTIYNRRIIRIPRTTLRDARQRGTEEHLLQLEPISIEAYMQGLEMEGEEPVMQPLLPTEATPEHDPAQHAQINDWLIHLSARDETIVRLYYGLTEGDERAYSIIEITRMLGLTYQTVTDTLTRSLLRLKKLAEGNARLREKDGRLVVRGILHGHPLPVLTPEQESLLTQAADRICAQGMTISVRTLCQTSKLNDLYVRAFLKVHRHELPQESLAGTEEAREKREQARMRRVQQVYEQFLAEGKPIIQRYLARDAHVGLHTVRAFLHTHEKEQ